MSHFTNLKTSFKSLFHLENALNTLNIQYRREVQLSESGNSKLFPLEKVCRINLRLSTDKNHADSEKEIVMSDIYDIIFNWNGKEYELVFDPSFWVQPYSVEKFINKISQQYANSVILTESQKIGFQPIKSKQHFDGSTTITLQRWNTSNF